MRTRKNRSGRWAKMGTYCLEFVGGLLFGIVLARCLLWPLILRLFLIPVMFG